MTDIKWGEPLSGDVMEKLGLPGDTPCKIENGFTNDTTVGDWLFKQTAQGYQLPADHAAYIVAAHNAKHGTDFVYWAGGDAAPEGWHDALFRDGETLSATRQHGRSASTWVHIGSATDIIGYTRKTEEPAKPTLDLSKPVQTRDGRPVRILCTDGPSEEKPVIGIISPDEIHNWTHDGRILPGVDGKLCKDLINVPERVVEWFGLHPSEGAYGREERRHVEPAAPFHLRITWTDGIPEARVFAADEEEG